MKWNLAKKKMLKYCIMPLWHSHSFLIGLLLEFYYATFMIPSMIHQHCLDINSLKKVSTHQEKVLYLKNGRYKNNSVCLAISSGVSHSDGSCVLGRIHSDVSSNIPKKVYHIVTDNFVNLLLISYVWLYKTECWGRKFHALSFNSHRNC